MKLKSFLNWKCKSTPQVRKIRINVSDTTNRLYEDYKYKQDYMNALKIIYQYKEGKDCTFHPQTNQGYYFSPSYQNKTVCTFQQTIIGKKKDFIGNNNSSYIYNNKIKDLKIYNAMDIKGVDINEKRKKTETKPLKRHCKTKSMEDISNDKKAFCINTSFIDLDKTYMFTKVGKRKINYYPKPPNDYGGFLTHRIVRNNSSLNINTKTTRTNIEELNGISTNRINYQTNSIHKRTSSSTTAMDINREIKTKETIDAKTINQPQTVRKNSNTINSTLRLDLQNSLESNNNTYKNNHPNQVLSIANGNFTLSPSYPQVTHVTLQSLSDAKILEIANHYVGTDESLEKFKLNLKK